MINADNLVISFSNSLDKPVGGFVKASVVRGPDNAGAFTLRLDGGREISGTIEQKEAKAWMTPGQNVLINLSDGRIIVPDTPQTPLTEPQQQPPPPLDGLTQQVSQTPVQPFVGMSADVFISGEVARQIRDGLESPLLRSLPAELIEKIAIERGGIDMDALSALDAVLRNRSLPVDMSSPVQLERLEQWLRLALDNPKLVEDLADRIPILGAREIIDKFLQLNRLGANFLPNDLLRQLSVELFFLGNNVGNAIGDSVNSIGQNPGLNAADVLKNAIGNTVNSELLKELFAKAFSAAPAALLDLVNRIDSSDINANNVKMPPEEARRLLSELVNRLPTQVAGKPELVHDIRQLSPNIAEVVITSSKESSKTAAHVIPSRVESSNINIIPNRAESSNVNIVPNRPESSNNVNIIPNRAESSNNVNIIPNRPESFNNVNIIPNKSVSSNNVNIIPNRPELSRANVIPNRIEQSNVSIIPNRAESSSVNIIPNRPESSNVNITPNRPESHNAHIISSRTDLPAQPSQVSTASLLEPSRDARHPVPQNIYDRIESTPRFNIPAENKNAVFSQIGTAQETIRSVIDGSARTANTRVAADIRAVSNNIPADNRQNIQLTQQATVTENNRYNPQFTQQAGRPEISSPQFKQQATVPAPSSPLPQAAPSETVVRQSVSNDVAVDNRHTAQFKQQATNPADNRYNSQFTQQASEPKTSSPQFTQQASISGAPSSSPPQAATNDTSLKQAVNSGTNTDNTGNISNTGNAGNRYTAQPAQQAVAGNINTDNSRDARQAPDMLTQTARRVLDNTEKLRAGFQEAFSSLDLQSRVTPSDFSGGAESSAVRQSLDALRLETLLNASKALQDIFSIVEELRGAVELFSDKSRELTGAEKQLADAVENLARQARARGNEIADRLNDILRELNRMQQDGLKGDGIAAARRSPAEMMRSAALTAAGGLESLHLLASTARGQELQQQVVALPVKIGDEWTEVHVKIIKERKGKDKKEKKEGDGHVSVYLNVAPSMLGDVTAHLDYHPPASLKLSFQFGKPEATKWFREQAAALKEALSAAGLPGTALEFHTRRRPVRARRVEEDAQDAQNADNQSVTPVGVGGGRGKVDFRA